MGKPTGFLEYDRVDKNSASLRKRESRILMNFIPLFPRRSSSSQGARCMDCGVPFCQAGVMIAGMASGCPLHNLIPEWNDLVYHGKLGAGLSSVCTKTSSFPEFTGRVCPALCEKACTCNLNGEPVSTKEQRAGHH